MSSHPPPPHAEDSHIGHEPDRVGVREVVTVGLILGAVVVGALYGLSLLYARLQPTRERATPSAWRRDERPPVDFDQPAQLRALREWEEKELSTYAWRNEDKTVARVPIERAMEMLVENGDPFTPAEEEATTIEAAKQENPSEPKKAPDETTKQ